MKTLTQAKVTPGQVKQITRMISDVGDSEVVQQAIAGLTKNGAERLKGNPEFTESVRQFVCGRIGELSVTNQFANEEVPSNYGYLSGYRPKGLTEQCNQLCVLFPGIGFCNQELLAKIECGKVELPKGAEGWFALLNIWKTGGLPIFGPTYSTALQKVLDTIKQTRHGRFVNYREGQLNDKQLRQSARAQKSFTDLSVIQGDPDILIISAQFGLRHRGRSVRRAIEVMADAGSEFGLGAFAVGIMILTHPERLMHFDDLWIDCAGDEFDDPDSDGRFGRALCFYFDDSEVELDTCPVADAYELYGSVSGFLS
jgi:hypothetical protein